MVAIVMTTYMPEGPIGDARLVSAKATMRSYKNLLDIGDDRLLILSEDGNTRAQQGNLVRLLVDAGTGGWTVCGRDDERHGVGFSMNAAFGIAFEKHDVVFYAQDDWELIDYADLTPWVALLEDDPSVGCVRVGVPHPNITGTVALWPFGWALRLDRSKGGYCVGFRPALYHKRFIDAYGPFPEDYSAWECERIYNEHFARTSGPDIVLALPCHEWRNVGTVEVGTLDPRS